MDTSGIIENSEVKLIHAACEYTANRVANLIKFNVEFDIKGFLENIVLVDLANPVSPFLLGRCLWIGSKFPKYLSRTTTATSSTSDSSDNLAHTPMGRFVEATVRGLQADQIAVVRIAAVRAIWGFCSHLRNTASKKHLSEETSIERALLNPVLPATIDALKSENNRLTEQLVEQSCLFSMFLGFSHAFFGIPVFFSQIFLPRARF